MLNSMQGAVVNSPLPGNNHSQPDGRIIQQSGGVELSIVTDNGFRKPFASATAFLNLGYQFCNIAVVTDYNAYYCRIANHTISKISSVQFGRAEEIIN